MLVFFCQAEDGIRDYKVTGVQTCALPISVTPGVALRSEPTARVAGIVWMTSEFITISRRVVWTSTTGVSPVTVMVSSSAPTQIGRASCRERGEVQAATAGSHKSSVNKSWG